MALLPYAKNEAELTGPVAQVNIGRHDTKQGEQHEQRQLLMGGCRQTVLHLYPHTPPPTPPPPSSNQVRLRSSTLVAIRRFAAEHKVKEPKAILDAGCSGEHSR